MLLTLKPCEPRQGMCILVQAGPVSDKELFAEDQLGARSPVLCAFLLSLHFCETAGPLPILQMKPLRIEELCRQS
jgi:hypothetical protein